MRASSAASFASSSICSFARATSPPTPSRLDQIEFALATRVLRSYACTSDRMASMMAICSRCSWTPSCVRLAVVSVASIGPRRLKAKVLL